MLDYQFNANSLLHALTVVFTLARANIGATDSQVLRPFPFPHSGLTKTQEVSQEVRKREIPVSEIQGIQGQNKFISNVLTVPEDSLVFQLPCQYKHLSILPMFHMSVNSHGQMCRKKEPKENGDSFSYENHAPQIGSSARAKKPR